LLNLVAEQLDWITGDDGLDRLWRCIIAGTGRLEGGERDKTAGTW
jgi:hypothetical protein